MRITRKQQQIIKSKTQKIFGDHADILLFGSRVRDEALGGDIDLLITLPQPTKNLLKKNLELNSMLQLAMGGLQKIDIVTYILGSVKTALHHEALRTGIRL